MTEHETLTDVLDAVAGDDRGLTFVDGERDERRFTFREVRSRALELLGEFQRRGLGPGDELVLFLNNNEKFLQAFWACLYGGIVPAPIAVGLSDEHRFKLFRIFDTLENPHLWTDAATLGRIGTFAEAEGLSDAYARMRKSAILVEQAPAGGEPGIPRSVAADSIAFVQFSSGATTEPKGVVLTHGNILANIRSCRDAASFNDRDVGLSWMPLTHDMGLIGMHLNMLANRIEHCLLPTDLFVRRPMLWLTKVAETKATILCSPNFGYRHFLKAFDPHKLAGADLSSVRLIFNGAEPISVELCDEFLAALSPFGLQRRSMYPVYGLAEASLAVSFPKLDETFRHCHLDRGSLGVGQAVVYRDAGQRNASSFARVGYPLAGCDLRISDDADAPASDGVVGHIQIRGANVTSGYYQNEAMTRENTTRDGWFRTGDLGFLSSGELVITGRSKDIIFVNGQNFYPHDLESIAQHATGTELGKVVACGVRPPGSPTDELIVFVMFRGQAGDFGPIATDVARRINMHAGLEVSRVVPVDRIPKTTSGKIQRRLLAAAYENGEFDEVMRSLDASRVAGPAAADAPMTRASIESRLLQICNAVAENKVIGPDDNLFEVGISSLVLVQIHERIERELPFQVEITDLFDYPSVSALAGFMEEAQKQPQAV